MFSIKHHFRPKTCITDNTFLVKAFFADNNNACRIFHRTYGDAAGILNIDLITLAEISATLPPPQVSTESSYPDDVHRRR